METLDTKVYLEIRVYGYPVGKKVRCHLWLEGDVGKEHSKIYLENNLELMDEYANATIEGVTVFNAVLSPSRPMDEDYNKLIVKSEVDAFRNKEYVKPLNIEQKLKLSSIDLSNYNNADITSLRTRLNKELFIREHNLTTEEYDFYVDNSNIVFISDIKEEYKRSNGDTFKLRKNKIRDNISKILNTTLES